MGQGGSSTSGQGLTGIQVAAALRITAASQLQRHRDRQVAAAASSDSFSDTTVKASLKRLDQSAYGERRQHEVQAPSASGDGEVKVEVTEYAPEVFRVIRTGEAVEEDVFADEWTLPEERLKMELGEGRSQALFLKSKNLRFMCKTVAEGEVDVLLSILKEYAAYVVEKPNALLMRFYMVLKVQVGKEEGYILCFNDVFGNATTLNEKWDIKGRVPKPGKFKYFPHLLRDAYAPDPYLIDTPRDEVVTDAGAREKHGNVVMVKAEEDKQKLPTHKDKELTRLFWLDEKQREKVVGQLLSDYAFLRGVGLMDYSILIGVSYNETKTSRLGKRYVVIKNMKAPHMVGFGDGADPVEVRPGSPRVRKNSSGEADDGSSARHRAVSEFDEGVHSLFDQEIYYIGIIDMLTKYGTAKKAANFFKSFLWHNDTLSTIPPKEYESRIARFTRIVFPVVSQS